MKKGLLIASLASVATITAGCAFAISANKGIRFEAVKAAEKSIVFDGTHSLPSPAGVFEAPNSYQVTSYTGAGDPVNVRTEGILPGSGSQTSYKVGGDYFMSNYHVDGSSNARLITTIGLNNITALTVEYGTIKNYYMECSIYFYDEDGASLGSQSHNSGEDKAKINTFVVDFVELAPAKEVRKAEIWAYSSFSMDNDSYFIKSISATWSC